MIKTNNIDNTDAWSYSEFCDESFPEIDSERFLFEFHHGFSKKFYFKELGPYTRDTNDLACIATLRYWLSKELNTYPIEMCQRACDLPWMEDLKNLILANGANVLDFPYVPAGIYLDLLRYYDSSINRLSEFIDGIALLGFVFSSGVEDLDEGTRKYLFTLVRNVFAQVPFVNGSNACSYYHDIADYYYTPLTMENTKKFRFTGGPEHPHSDISSDNVEVFTESHGQINSLSEKQRTEAIKALPSYGQLKIFESMASFFVETLKRNPSVEKVIVLGSAPGMSYDALQALFPTLKFLVVDPFPSIYPSTFVVWDWSAEPGEFLEKFLEDSFFCIYSDVNFLSGKTHSEKILDLTDKYLSHIPLHQTYLVGLCEKFPCAWSESNTITRNSGVLHYQAFHSGTETRLWTFHNFFDRGAVRSESLESSLDYYRLVTCNRHVKHGQGVSLFKCFCHSCCKLSTTIRKAVELYPEKINLEQFQVKFGRLYRRQKPLYTKTSRIGTVGKLFYQLCLQGPERTFDGFIDFAQTHRSSVDLKYIGGVYWLVSRDQDRFNLTVQLSNETSYLQEASGNAVQGVKILDMGDGISAISPRHYFDEKGLHVQVGIRGWKLYSDVTFYGQQDVPCIHCSSNKFPYAIWYPYYVGKSYSCGCSNGGVLSEIELPT